MNDRFESQKEKLLAIKQEISLLYQQVNYLLRNGKPIGLLDLDVLMNRTHTLYDQLCAINLGEEVDDVDLPFDAEDLVGLFGSPAQDDPEEAQVEETAPSEVPPLVEETPAEKPAPMEEAPAEAPKPVLETPVKEDVQVVEPEKNEFVEPEEKPLSDEFGIFFRFEDIPEEKTPEVMVEDDGRMVHMMEAIPEDEIPERDRVHGDELVHDNPLEMPKMENERPVVADEEIARQDVGLVSGFFEHDDDEFELSAPEVLGEKMMGEDNSLAAKLQQNPIRDLKSVIGINDKFLFVNELFGGSMEKYNKSIDNLNDLKTLNGALIYLNELKIELQWNNSNEAYQKLKELVARKFE